MSSWLFGSKKSANSDPSPATALRIQTSAQGLPRAIGWGQGRLSGNLLWYDDFTPIAHYSSSGGGGGKGGLFGSGSQGSLSYTYTVATIVGVCEGPVSAILSAWENKTEYTLATLNLTAFLGTYAQSAWGYVTSLHPTQALNLRGLAYL